MVYLTWFYKKSISNKIPNPQINLKGAMPKVLKFLTKGILPLFVDFINDDDFCGKVKCTSTLPYGQRKIFCFYKIN